MALPLKIAPILLFFLLLPLSSASGAETDLKSWTAKVHEEFSAKQRYPRRAIKANIEGKILVDIKVNNAGSIVAFNIKQSSGSSLLDGDVINLLARVDPLPGLPNGMTSTSLTVPIAYRLEKYTRKATKPKAATKATSMRDWSKKVSRILARNHSYPTGLLKSGIEGVVVVELVVSSSGDISAQRVIESSGNEVLDMDALDMFWQIKPLPALPIGRDNHKVKIPLRYRITGH